MKKNILLVDDQIEIIEYIKEYLEEEGFRVFLAESGREALDILYSETVDIDLVITDISMKDMDGYELFLKIKEYDSDIPVFMITAFGYDKNHAIVKSKREGLTEVLNKPVKKDKLLRTVKKFLNK